MHAEGTYYDRDEVKRTIPTEREMFDQITAAIEQCQGILLYNAPHSPVTVEADVDEGGEPEPVLDDTGTPAIPVPALHKAHLPHTHPSTLVRALENMESFMGVDGRIYTLSKGDIVTLPERNAAVLSERNIVLNINLCK
jgi:DNA replication factor GINS